MPTDLRRHAELRIPADRRLLRMARVTAAAMAADLPFTIQDVEDLRVAVDELSAALIEGCAPNQTLDLDFEVDDGDLLVSGRVVGAGAPTRLHPVASDLLALVADGHQLDADGEDRVFSFTKRAGSSAT